MLHSRRKSLKFHVQELPLNTRPSPRKGIKKRGGCEQGWRRQTCVGVFPIVTLPSWSSPFTHRGSVATQRPAKNGLKHKSGNLLVPTFSFARRNAVQICFCESFRSSLTPPKNPAGSGVQMFILLKDSRKFWSIFRSVFWICEATWVALG